MVNIVQKGNAILRRKARAVPQAKIKSPEIQKIIKLMREGIASREDAVAIAAPQVGHSVRIFMVADRAFAAESEGAGAEHLVFINPEIVKRSRKKEETDEGCLSVDGWYGKTKRSAKVTVRAYNERGDHFERGASGLLAQIIQHETDHLDGILFIDHAIKLAPVPKDVPEEKIKHEKRSA